MNFFTHLYDTLRIPLEIEFQVYIALLALLLILLCVQLYYYVVMYGPLPGYRNNRGIRQQVPTPPISVVVVVQENGYYFIENTLPKLLAQEYPDFEVVVVDCSYNEDISSCLHEMAIRTPHLKLTQIRAQHNLSHSIKLAITVGIKAATHEHMLFTTANSYPQSGRWMALMAKGFISGDLVIGYCAVEQKGGWINRLIRCSRLSTSVRYLARAIHNHTYRGTSHNMGYTKTLYFSNRGFDHLNMNIGEDDLFIQRIANRCSVSVVMNPQATMLQLSHAKIGWWNNLREFYTYAYRFYPKQIRRSIGLELWSRFLLNVVVVIGLVVAPGYWKLLPAGVFVLRTGVMIWNTGRIAKRLGEHNILGTYLIYDLIAPLREARLALKRRIRPNTSVWR